MTAAFEPGAIEEAWENAVDFWGRNIALSPPQPLQSQTGDDGEPADEPLAYIDLEDRQVVVNLEKLEAIGAAESLTAVFAHEVGHHIEFPRTLGLMAELQVMERRLLPDYPDSLVNLFLDLQVNEVVGQRWEDELCAVYRGSGSLEHGRISAIYVFYLAVYEELWRREPGSLVGASSGSLVDDSYPTEWMDEHYPGWRGEARMFSQTFFGLPYTHLQFVYFCSIFGRYTWDTRTESTFSELPLVPLSGDAPEPSPSDYAGAIRSASSGKIDDSIEEGKERGWIESADMHDMEDIGGSFGLIDELVHAGHGKGSSEFRRALVEDEYATMVDRHLFALPADDEPPGARTAVPTTVEPWEFGEDPSRIDWVESVLQKGPLAGAEPLRREYERPDPAGSESGPADLEIYLDTSGSMPNPTEALNAMTLAAQILSAAAIRDEARVRAVVYSSGSPVVSDWMYHEPRARQFLLHFAGGGTDFPFDKLEEWSDERRGAVRVIISDDGFLENLRENETAPTILERAVDRSNPLVAMLAQWHPDESSETPAPLPTGHDRFRLVSVDDVSALGAAATQLADAFFD